MGPAERLEICFTSNPPMLVSTIVVDDNHFTQTTFRDQLQLATWISTLEDIAAVTRNAQRATFTAKRRDATTTETQALAVSGREHHPAEHDDDQSSGARDAVSRAPSLSSHGSVTTSQGTKHRSNALRTKASQAQSEQRRPPQEIDSVEPENVTSPHGSTARGDDMPLPTMPMDLSPRSQRGETRTTSYTDGTLFETSTESPNSSAAQSSFFSSTSSMTSIAMEELTPKLKRRKKLDMLLERIRDQINPDQTVHNEKVDNLCNSTVVFTSAVPTTATQFGHLLGDLGHVSDVLGFMYGLLSWEIFRREEDRLVRDEGQSTRWAAKRMNDEMSKQSDRHTTTKDWASDGRRAAGMVFRSIVTLNAASKSLAVFLLADLAILDNLIKIAHFPVLRERFTTVFKEIHESRQRRHNPAEDTLYKVFDFEAFLSIDRQSMTLATLDSMARLSQVRKIEHFTPLNHLQDLLLSSVYVDNNHESPKKRRRVSPVSITEDTDAVCSSSLDTGNNGGDLVGTNTVPTRSNRLVVATDENERSLFTGPDEGQSGGFVDSPQTQDYNILFGPSPDFDTSFHGQKSS